jgi:hypothetical protein
MTVNPRRPGIFILTGCPVGGLPPLQGSHAPHLGGLSTHTTHKCDTSRRLGGLIPHISLIPQSSRQTNGLGFTRWGD